VPIDVASTFVQEVLIVEPKQKDSTKPDEETVLPENTILEGAHDVKFEFDDCVSDQPSMVREDTKL
jgi:hypothetical protein